VVGVNIKKFKINMVKKNIEEARNSINNNNLENNTINNFSNKAIIPSHIIDSLNNKINSLIIFIKINFFIKKKNKLFVFANKLVNARASRIDYSNRFVTKRLNRKVLRVIDVIECFTNLTGKRAKRNSL
jgi:hypothetical protein